MTREEALERWSRAIEIVAVLSIAALAFATQWRLWSESPEPVGVDNYYVALQVRGLLENGALPIAARPLAFWLLAPVCAWLGPLAGVKLGAAATSALASAFAFFAGRALAAGLRPASRVASGAVAGIVVATSAGSVLLGADFVKNAIGIALFFAFTGSFVRALAAPRPARVVLAAALFAAVAFTHALALVFAFALALPALASRAAPEKFGKPGFGAAAIIACVVTARVTGIGPIELALPVFALGSQGTLGLAFEPALAVIAAVAALVTLPRLDGVVVGLAIIAIAIAQPWLDVHDADGIASRLRIVSFVPLALCGAVLAGALVERRRVALVGLAIAMLAFVATRPPREHGVAFTSPAAVDDAIALQQRLPQCAKLVSPSRALVFMTSYYARVDARQDRRGDDELPIEPCLFHVLSKSNVVALGGAVLLARLRPSPEVYWLPAHELLLVPDDEWRRVRSR